ncbi:MAG: IS630 family transposase [Chloroflexi bacterium]|nr:MAG: IS630 family transposase [Chloroflexota bacterium]
MKKIQAGHLSKKHLKKLRRLQRHRLTIVSRRATILILSYQGRSCSQIADMVGLHVQTVRNWIKAFNSADRKGRWNLFKPQPHPGRKPTFDEKVQQGLLDIFKESPRKYGFSDSRWTLHRLAEVAVRTGLVSSISHESVRRLINKSKHSYRRLKAWLKITDSQYDRKKRWRDWAVAWAKQDATVSAVYQDESWFSGNPRLVRGWVGPLHKGRVIILQDNLPGFWVLYAAMDVEDSRVHRYYAEKCNNRQVKKQLLRLLKHYEQLGKRVLIVIWDNASYHKAGRLRRWFRRYNRWAKREGRIRLLVIRLPKRSPWLNPIESIFMHTKAQVPGPLPYYDPYELKRLVELHFEEREARLAQTR